MATDHSSSMQQVALEHARKGFRVFPIKENAKSPPLIKEWQKFATSDEAQIRSWWKQWPSANVGLECSGYAVLDIDVKKQGFESLAALEKDIAGGLEATYETETPSKGRHIYYGLPRGVAAPNGVDVLGPGIDIRSASGYVLAAGSKTAAGDYSVYADEPIAEADPAIIKRCGVSRPKAERQSTAPIPDAPEIDVSRAKEWLKLHAPAIEHTGGDKHTLDTAAKLKDYGLSKAQAIELMAGEWNARCVPSWDVDALATKVENAYQYLHETKSGELSASALIDQFSVVTPEEKQAAEEAQAVIAKASGKRPLYLFPADEGKLRLDLKRKPVKRRYIVPGLLPAGITAILAGHGGSCKSLAALYLAVSVALGKPFFNLPAGEPGAVFVALGEEDEGEAYRRLYGIVEQLGLTEHEITLLGERIRLYPCLGKDIRLTGHTAGTLVSTGVAARIGDEMKAHAKACGLPPALVILDHFMLLSGGEVNANEDAAFFAQETGQIVVSTGASVLTLAHSPKADDRKKLSQHSVLGAVSTANLARLVLLIQRMIPTEATAFRIEPDDSWHYLNLWVGKANYTQAGRGLWFKEDPTEHDTVTLRQVALTRKTDDDTVLCFLRAARARGEYHTLHDLEGKSKAIGLGQKKLREVVSRLLAEGRITEEQLPADQRQGGRQTYLEPKPEAPLDPSQPIF